MFFLTWQELIELTGGAAMFPGSVRRTIATRRAEHARLSATTPPDSFTLAEGEYLDDEICDPIDASDAVASRPGDVLSGTSACGGRVTGRATVLESVTEASLLARGDVLVTKQTDPGWGPVFSAHLRARDRARRHVVARRDHRARVRNSVRRRREGRDATHSIRRDGHGGRAIGERSMSSRELIVRYVRERAQAERVRAARLGDGGDGQVDGWTGGQADGTWQNTCSPRLRRSCSMLAFRVWDDLEDRSRDAREHPDRRDGRRGFRGAADRIRVRARYRSARCRSLSVRGRVRVWARWPSRSRFSRRGIACDPPRREPWSTRTSCCSSIRCSRLPPRPRRRRTGALVSLYLVLCVYEIVDDPALRASIVARWVAISECALVSVILATATLFGGRIP